MFSCPLGTLLRHVTGVSSLEIFDFSNQNITILNSYKLYTMISIIFIIKSGYAMEINEFSENLEMSFSIHDLKP